jgi:SAM-dependent methyltransferase
MDKMTAFRDQYLATRSKEPLKILDLGSQDVNGSYRPLFENPRWTYVGLDMASGKNVDIVLKTPYVWKEVQSNSADVVVSGQAFEHIQFFWITMLEIARVLKPGGICCILAPSGGREHRYPVDCWRFYPDGMAALAQFAQMDLLQAATEWEALGYSDESDLWHDSILVCRKPNLGAWWMAKSGLKRWLQHYTATIGMA